MTLYDVLEVRTDASADDIKAAYRQLALEHHPDRGGSAKRMTELTEAYAVLRDPETRAAYDRALARNRRAQRPQRPQPAAPRPPAGRPTPARPSAFETFLGRVAGHVLDELDRSATEILASRMAGRRVTLEEILAATGEDRAPTTQPRRGRGTGTPC